MAIWLDDLIEQIATAMALADSGNPTGKRLAFIIVDNAVEYLMKAYIETETQLIGSGKPVKKADWDELKKDFRKVSGFVFKQFPSLTATQCDIESYHDTRNSLYHEAKSISVEANKISKYIEQFKILLNDLLKFKMSDDQWRKRAYDVSQLIAKKEAQTKIVITYTNEKGQTRFDKPNVTISDTDAIMLAIHSYSHYFGDAPSVDDIYGILNRSSHSLDKSTISKRVHNLRNRKMMLEDKLLLRPKAIDRLRKKFAIIPAPVTI